MSATPGVPSHRSRAARTTDSTRVPSAGLRRDLEVLRELVSEESLRRGGLGVVRIAERLGREKSQVSRALHALEAEGMVERDPLTRTYQLGPHLYVLASRGVEARLVAIATRRLRVLAEEQRAIVSLRVLIGGQVLSLVTVQAAGTAPARPATGSTARSAADGRPGESAGATAAEGDDVASTPAGPALLLDWPPEAIDQILSVSDESTRTLAEQIESLRRHGFATGTDPDRPSWAVPVRDFRGVVLAAVELTPLGEVDEAAERAHLTALTEVGRQIGAQLGFDTGLR